MVLSEMVGVLEWGMVGKIEKAGSVGLEPAFVDIWLSGITCGLGKP